jgi:hypothetical protein
MIKNAIIRMSSGFISLFIYILYAELFGLGFFINDKFILKNCLIITLSCFFFSITFTIIAYYIWEKIEKRCKINVKNKLK